MEITLETITIFVFLIPGFLSSLILNTVVVRKEKETLAKIIEALVFTFLIYGIVSLFVHQSPVLLNSEKVGDLTKSWIHYNPKVVFPTIGLSVLLPIVIGYFTTNDKHMAWLRKLKITDRTSRESVWEDVFTDQKRYVVVNLSDGRRVFGWPMYYSGNPDEGLIYLYNAAWVADDGKYLDMKGHGLFLVKRDNIDSIVFLKLDKASAVQQKQKKDHE